MLLSDKTIKQLIQEKGLIQGDLEDILENTEACSTDLRMDNVIKIQKSFSEGFVYDFQKKQDVWTDLDLIDIEYYIIEPGQFLLASTKEYVKLPGNIAGKVEGRSSLARAGLQVHITAGWIDPGFEGNITLELVNLAPRPIFIYSGMRFCQICFYELNQESENNYSTRQRSKYNGQTGPTESKFYRGE